MKMLSYPPFSDPAATEAKMARGEMVRYLAEHQVEDPEGIKGFDRLGYHFEEALSTEKEYVFLK